MHAVSRTPLTHRLKGALRRLTNHGHELAGAPDPEATYRKSLNYHVAALAFASARPRFRVVVSVDAASAAATCADEAVAEMLPFLEKAERRA